MIVLHEQKLIVLKARKVGGTSFEIALSKFASEKSIITPIRATDEQIRISLGFRGPQNYHYSTQELLLDNHNQKIPLKFFNHITASLAKERLGNEIWDSYKKVAIIRNPFDRMISSYFWAFKTEESRACNSFEDYVLTHIDEIKKNNHIYKIGGKNIIDFMIRYDRLKEDIDTFVSQHQAFEGLTETFLSISAKSEFRPKTATTQKMFAQAPGALSFISNICAEDIRDYDFHVPEC